MEGCAAGLRFHERLHTRWTVIPAGGHFVPMEESERLGEDVRAFFRPLR